MTEEQWYYSTQGRQVGPVSREMLRSMIVTAQVRETDLVWRVGMPKWTAAQTVAELMNAPMPSQQGLTQPERVVIEMAGFWRRLFAAIIDAAVLSVLTVVIALVVLIAVGNVVGSLDAPLRVQTPALTTEIAIGVAVLLLHWLYFAGMEASAYQATLGKLVIGIFVTDDEGLPLSFIQTSVRFVGRIVSAALLMIGFLMVAFTERKQALHDLMAGSIVVRRR